MFTGKIQPPGLRRRLIVALSIPLILILCVSSLLDYRLARETSDSANDQALADAVFDLESHIRSQPSLAAGMDLTQESEAMLRSNAPDKVYFSIRDSSQRLLAGDADIPEFAMPSGAGVAFADALYHDETVRVAVRRVSLPEAPIFITVLGTTQKRMLSRQKILTAMLLPNLAVIVAALLAVLFGVRQGLLPLELVEREIASRSPSDLCRIDLATSPREIHPMLQRLNELFALLDEAYAAQNRFIADAAHQLRTPLAALQTHIDLAVGEGAFAGNAGRQQSIEEATARLERLLGQLLSSARAEAAGSVAERMEPVWLDRVAEKSASDFFDAALAKGIDLGFDICPVAIIGQPWLLQEALANLIDNAIRYTPDCGVITVRCGETGGKPFLEVEDDGPGIAEEHQAKIFQRFYRVPGSPSNGCGLGLPIVREIAELHGAAVLLVRRDSGGLCVRLQFPAAIHLADDSTVVSGSLKFQPGAPGPGSGSQRSSMAASTSSEMGFDR
ncbi:MAG: sensor histidine kinase [Bacteroidota bacterium]